MKHKRPQFLLIFLFLFSFAAPDVMALSDRWTSEVYALLDTLDVLLKRSDEFNAVKDARINSLRRSLGQSSDEEHKYWISRQLYEENSCYDSDSAMYYADLCCDIARGLGKQEWIDEMNLNRSYIYSATGLLDRSQSALDSVDTSRLSNRMLVRYYERMLFLQTHLDQFLGRNNADRPYPPNIEMLMDSICETVPTADSEYSWFLGWRALRRNSEIPAAVELLKRELGNSGYDTRDDARRAWLLSNLYEHLGEKDNKMKYLVLSAIADVRSSNKEIASIEEISGVLLNVNDISRAHDYINYSVKCAREYRSRVRVNALAQYQEIVFLAINAYRQSRIEAANRNNTVLFICLGILMLAFAYIYIQMKVLKRSRHALDEANSRLEERVVELQDTRSELKEANEKLTEMYASAQEDAKRFSAWNEEKERYIANLFTICSNYINKLDDFRKNIYHKVMAKQFNDLFDMVKSPELSHSEIKELYANFDSIFLQIYPDFVSDFNSLLRPEERITPKKGMQLTTELRIYALVRLGLNDSVAIAKFLHCSVQTVYNVRQLTRKKSDIPGDRFAEAVQSLGKTKI